MIRPHDYIAAARVPNCVKEMDQFPWQIIRRTSPDIMLGFPTQTMLCRWSMSSLHMTHGEIVMDDSLPELRRHLPIWLNAHGRVLKTGLGLGCVVRGLLIKSSVVHIDVVEIDEKIIAAIGPEFEHNPRVTIHHADAHQWDIQGRAWDFIWHDIHDNDETEDLVVQHGRLLVRYLESTPIEKQGAWMFPRIAKRQFGRMLGSGFSRR